MKAGAVGAKVKELVDARNGKGNGKGKGNVTEALLQECQVEKSTKDKEIKLYHSHD